MQLYMGWTIIHAPQWTPILQGINTTQLRQCGIWNQLYNVFNYAMRFQFAEDCICFNNNTLKSPANVICYYCIIYRFAKCDTFSYYKVAT